MTQNPTKATAVSRGKRTANRRRERNARRAARLAAKAPARAEARRARRARRRLCSAHGFALSAVVDKGYDALRAMLEDAFLAKRRAYLASTKVVPLSPPPPTEVPA